MVSMRTALGEVGTCCAAVTAAAQGLDQRVAAAPPDRSGVGFAGRGVGVGCGQRPDRGLENGAALVVGGESVFPHPGRGFRSRGQVDEPAASSPGGARIRRSRRSGPGFPAATGGPRSGRIRRRRTGTARAPPVGRRRGDRAPACRIRRRSPSAVTGSTSPERTASAAGARSGRRSSLAVLATVVASRRECQAWSATHAAVDAALGSIRSRRGCRPPQRPPPTAPRTAPAPPPDRPANSPRSPLPHWNSTVCRSRNTAAHPAITCRRSERSAAPPIPKTLLRGSDNPPQKSEPNAARPGNRKVTI